MSAWWMAGYVRGRGSGHGREALRAPLVDTQPAEKDSRGTYQMQAQQCSEEYSKGDGKKYRIRCVPRQSKREGEGRGEREGKGRERERERKGRDTEA